MSEAPGARPSAERTWDWRWARRGALLLAPLTALAALVHAMVVLREPPVTALVHYGLGAVYGGLLGLALAGLVSLLKQPRAARSASARPARRAWVVHPRRVTASSLR